MSHITAELMGFFNDMKTCTKCKIEKEFSEFNKSKKGKNGLASTCKYCSRQYYIDNKEYLSKKAKQYYIENKEEINKKSIKYYVKNKEHIKERNKQYVLDNRKKINDHRKNRILNDPLFKLSCDIRSLINISVKKQGYTKKSKTYNILGCSLEEFKQHLENKFTEGMTWENQGKWHMDHIYPVSRATDEQHLIQLNHYTNFQPLWAEDNWKKLNKIQ